MPVISEEALEATRSVLIRDLNLHDPVDIVEDRFDEIKDENPIFFAWLTETATALMAAALIIPPHLKIDGNIPVDEERAFVSLKLAQNTLLMTGVQIYKVIKASLEAKELEEDGE